MEFAQAGAHAADGMPMLFSKPARAALLVPTILVAAGLSAPAALSAEQGSYSGDTDQNRPVTFKVRDGKVKSFEAGITLYCVFEGTFQFNAVIAPKAMRVKANNRFDYVGEDEGETADIEIHGRFVTRKKATGTIEMGGGGCAGEAKFTATRR
jgi:hypothetical protein